MLSPLTAREIVLFAEKNNVPVEKAYALPVIFEKIAKEANRPLRSIISQATYFNQELADYIKELAIQIG